MNRNSIGSLSSRERDYYAGSSSQLERQNAERAAAQLRAELERPLPRLHDPAITVRVIEPIRAGDPIRVVVAGEVISMPRSLAQSLAGIRRVEIV